MDGISSVVHAMYTSDYHDGPGRVGWEIEGAFAESVKERVRERR